MLLLAHTGLTLGFAYTWDRILERRVPYFSGNSSLMKAASAMKAIDYRIVLIGSMLPDIIDKPLGHFIFPDTFDNNGRIFSHTLLFFVLLLCYGIFRYYQYSKNGVLVLALCSGGHLILDGMWDSTRTLFWPILGWQFPSTDIVDFREWIEAIDEAARTDPEVTMTETLGLLILITFFANLWKKRNLGNFIKKGIAS